MSHIPTPDSVTPEWITEQLQANGIDAGLNPLLENALAPDKSVCVFVTG
jgi:hypothetical protein